MPYQGYVPTIQAAASAGVLEYTEFGGGDASWVVREAKLTREELSRPSTGCRSATS